MKKHTRLNREFSKFSKEKQRAEDFYYGELGIPLNGAKQVEVSGRNGYVYVRLRGNRSELIEAYNQSVPSIYDLPVIVKRVKNSYSVVGRDNTKYSNIGSGASGGVIPLPRHGGQHSLNPDLNMGADVSWIYSRQFMPMLLYPSGTSTQLSFSPSFYEWNGQWKYVNPTGSINLSSYVPTITGSANMVLIWLEGDTGNFRVSSGAGFSGGVSNYWEIANYIPDIDRNVGLPLMAVKLETGTTSLDWSNLYDVRDFYTVGKRFNGIGIQDDGTPAGTGTILNFGTNLSVSFAGNIATINGAAGGGGTSGFQAQNEGVPLGTGLTLNFIGDNVDASISGTVVRVYVTGSAGGSGMTIWDEGVSKGTATILDVVSTVADISISGTVARLFITGSVSASAGTGTATYLRVGQPTPLSSVTGTYWKTPEPYVTGSLAIFNQGHVLIIGTDYTEQYPQSGTYQYTVAQETGTYHLSIYGVAGSTTPAGGGSNPPVTGSVILWDEGVNQGSATILNFVGGGVVASVSGTVANIFVTGSNSPTVINPLSDVSGSVLCLRADSITGTVDGGTVQTWADESTSLNNATMPTAGLRPIYVSKAFNNKPALLFNNSDYYDLTNNIDLAACTVFVVFNTFYKSGYAGCLAIKRFGVYSLLNTIGWGVYRNANLNGGEHFPSHAGIACVKYNTSVTSLRSNGRSLPVSGGSDTAFTTSRVGYDGSASQYHWGLIAEILVYNTSLSDSDTESVEKYLSVKYGIQINKSISNLSYP